MLAIILNKVVVIIITTTHELFKDYNREQNIDRSLSQKKGMVLQFGDIETTTGHRFKTGTKGINATFPG